MKVSFKITSYSGNSLIVVQTGKTKPHHSNKEKGVRIRLFDEETIDRLTQLGNELKPSKEIIILNSK